MNKYNLCVLKYISFYSLTLVADIVIFRFCLFRLFFLIIVILADLIFVFFISGKFGVLVNLCAKILRFSHSIKWVFP